MSFDITKYNNDLLFIPLGGANEIGMNLNLYHYKGKYIIMDMGIGFADQKFPGVDILIPLTTMLENVKKDIIGIFLTHAHEDHIGSVQYIISQLDCKVYTTKFTKAVLELKLQEFDLDKTVKIEEVQPNTKIKAGPFSVEFLGITHSIPEMHGIMIRTDKGNIFHSGDWKLDPEPGIGPETNMEELKKLGDEGVLAMVGDSTNIFNEGVSGSEGKLAKSLQKIISKKKKGLVVVTTFASNIARLHAIASAAQNSGRKVVLAGRSLWRMYKAALDTGYLQDLDAFLQPKNMSRLKKDEVVIICTGCQGEPLAATAKMANQSHPDIKIGKGDLIIFSSKIIPGNEKKIYEVLNKFCKLGVEIMTEKDHFVHVSGHPAKEEVRKMYELIRPEIAIPVHGEAMHLNEHCKFAKSLGIKKTIELENGDVILLDKDKYGKVGKVDSGYLAIDGNMIIDEYSSILRDRRNMRDNGLAIVLLIFNQHGKLIRQPKVLLPGIIDVREDGEILDNLTAELRDIVVTERCNRKNEPQVIKMVSQFMRKSIKKHRKKEPFVLVHIEYVSL